MQIEPRKPVALAPGRAAPPALSDWRSQVVTGARRSAAIPAIPLPIGTARTAARTCSGIERDQAASRSVAPSRSNKWIVPPWPLAFTRMSSSAA
jgi:hypothetical protein